MSSKTPGPLSITSTWIGIEWPEPSALRSLKLCSKNVRNLILPLFGCTSEAFLIKFKNDESYGFISNTYKDSLGENEIDDVTIELEKKLGLNGFKENYSLSQFIIIDPLDNETVGFGYVIYSLGACVFDFVDPNHGMHRNIAPFHIVKLSFQFFFRWIDK